MLLHGRLSIVKLIGTIGSIACNHWVASAYIQAAGAPPPGTPERQRGARPKRTRSAAGAAAAAQGHASEPDGCLLADGVRVHRLTAAGRPARRQLDPAPAPHARRTEPAHARLETTEKSTSPSARQGPPVSA